MFFSHTNIWFSFPPFSTYSPLIQSQTTLKSLSVQSTTLFIRFNFSLSCPSWCPPICEAAFKVSCRVITLWLPSTIFLRLLVHVSCFRSLFHEPMQSYFSIQPSIFNISYSSIFTNGKWKVNFQTVFVPENVPILTLYLVDSLAGYRSLHWKLFSLRNMKVLLFCPLSLQC